MWAGAHLRDVIGVDAVYGVTHVLRGGHHDREGQHAGGGQAVVHPDMQPSHHLGKFKLISEALKLCLIDFDIRHRI